MRINISPLDQLFSQFIRMRANNQCQRCGRWKEYSQLQCAHCFGRRKKSVRFDEDNALALCFPCHHIIDSEDPEAKRELFIKYLGEQGYKNLRIRAELAGRPDVKALSLYYKEKIKCFASQAK